MTANASLVWVDLEMTGLDPAECTIIEIATLVTTDQLELVAEGPSIVIHQSDETLARMSEAVRAMHTKSGLLELVRCSSVSLEQAAHATLEFVRQHCAAQSALLCGNSVWKDRSFLDRYMPELSRYLHYRIIDVSSVKELARRWYGPSCRPPTKADHHRALDDIRESIAELAWYRAHLFVTRPRESSEPKAPPG
jgi:oligoribonuclease